MLELPISVKENGDITIIQNTAYLEETMYAEKKGEKVKKKFIELSQNIKKIEKVDELIISKEKQKDPLLCWKVGQHMYNFIEWCYNEAIEIPNLSKALARYIDGNAIFWDLCLKFYAKNKNREYIKYPWWLCSVLAITVNSETRNKLVMAFENEYIKNQNETYLFKEIIENKNNRPREPTGGRKEILDALSKKNLTEQELSEITGLSRDSVRGRISELNGIHCYNIEKNDELYHLKTDLQEREKKIKKAQDYVNLLK